MSQIQVCSYCYLVQRMDREEHLKLTPKDVQRYIVHLRVSHGVILAPEISA